MACKLRIINGVPGNHGVVIKEAGAVFHKKAGGTVNDGPRLVNLTTGQHADFDFHGSDCIDEIFGVVEITIPNKPNEIFRFIKRSSTPGACMSFADAVLTVGLTTSDASTLTIDSSLTEIVSAAPAWAS